MFEIHKKQCKREGNDLHISVDGMSESKSTSVSIDVYSSRFTSCKMICPHRLVRPLSKYKIDHKEQFVKFLKDISASEALIKSYLADNPKRSIGRDCLCFSALYPCEYCYGKGVRYVPNDLHSNSAKNDLKKLRDKLAAEEMTGNPEISLIRKEIEKVEKKIKSASRSHIVWPYSTSHSEPRTNQSMLDIIEKINRSDGKLSKDEAKGVIGRSPLFDLPHFNFVRDVPVDYLHGGCLGVAKKMVELTFSVGENRERKTKQKLSKPSDFNELMQHIKVVREFSRRIRELDFALMKGQEYRNIVIIFFPIVLKCIEPQEKERKLWLQFAYMIRSCVLPKNEFKGVDLNSIIETCDLFYQLYEKLFGEKNCTYNTHVVSCHLIEMRYHGPLTFTSTFPFEAFYGEIRQSFTPGTPSTLKQIFKKILIKRILSHHTCENTIYYSSTETSLENNTLVYCFVDLTYKIYKIVNIQDDYLVCYRVGKYPHQFHEYSSVNWSKVGVFQKGPIDNELTKIHKNSVSGKVMEIDNLLITCPNNVLREK